MSMTDSGENSSSSKTTRNQSAGPVSPSTGSLGFIAPDGTNGIRARQKQSSPPWLWRGPDILKEIVCGPFASRTLPAFAHAMKRMSGLLSAAMFMRPRWPAARSIRRQSPSSSL